MLEGTQFSENLPPLSGGQKMTVARIGVLQNDDGITE